MVEPTHSRVISAITSELCEVGRVSPISDEWHVVCGVSGDADPGDCQNFEFGDPRERYIECDEGGSE